MGKNRVFFPQAALDQWLHEGRIDLTSNELVIRAEGRKYKIVEAVRILAEVSGGQDVHDLIGKVRTVAYLTELGAELLGDSIIISDLAYEVIPGFLGSPVGSFAEHRSSGSIPPPPPGAVGPKSDEELLAQFLMRNLE
jgi:hypothetical protein